MNFQNHRYIKLLEGCLDDFLLFFFFLFGQLRTVTINNEPWFVGKDVATALGYADPSSAVSKNVDAEDKTTLLLEQDGSNYKSKTTIISESGLYALIFGSKLESAKRFKHWVTSEVLPSIRKHGVYAVDELINNPEMAIKAFTALKEEREKNKVLIADNKRMKPKEIFTDLPNRPKFGRLVLQDHRAVHRMKLP